MFILRTGLQGNGKTLNTIKEVDSKAAKEGRDVYYHNVTGLKPDHPVLKANWIQFDDPCKWFELPDNAVIVIDEAQTWFRVRPAGSKVPDYASRLEIMRKQGHELHAITQSPKLIDSHMRELCNCHIHYNRGHGGKLIKRWEFQKTNLDVNKQTEFTDGQSSRVVVDKAYFGCYESVKEGAEHHFKFKPPKALFVVLLCVLAVIAAAWKVYDNRMSPKEADPQAVSVDRASSPGQMISSPSDRARPMTVEEYTDAHTARIPDVPWSAPIYDGIRQAVTYPRPVCLATADVGLIERNRSKMSFGYRNGKAAGCRCNSQQGTRLNVTFSACMDIVENGFFDPARPDAQSLQVQQIGIEHGSDGGAGRGVTQAPATFDSSVSRVGISVSGITNLRGSIQ